METPAALLILLASLAIGITSAALISRRHFRTLEQDLSAYRGTVTERFVIPNRVRAAVLASYAMAAMCAFRVVAAIDDIMNLADEPHVRRGLAPAGMHATVLAAIVMLLAAAAIPRLVQSGRDLARRSESKAPSRAIVLLVLSIAFALAELFAITRVPIVIYWQRRMVLYLVVHAVFAAATTVTLAIANSSLPSRER